MPYRFLAGRFRTNAVLAAFCVAALFATAVVTAVVAGRRAQARPRPAGFAIDGVDTARYQHPDDKAIDWAEVRRSGVEVATIKATRGVDVSDPWFTRDFPAAMKAGLAVGPYHFYDGRAAGTGARQADWFIAALRKVGYTGHRPGELPPVFDFEWDDRSGGCPAKVTVADAQAWLDKVQSAFGRKPIIYTQKSFLDSCLKGTKAFASYPMQLADYRSGISKPPLPAGSADWLMWQYDCTGTVPGIPAKVCKDVFKGTQADLDKLSSRTTPPTPTTTSAPASTRPTTTASTSTTSAPASTPTTTTAPTTTTWAPATTSAPTSTRTVAAAPVTTGAATSIPPSTTGGDRSPSTGALPATGLAVGGLGLLSAGLILAGGLLTRASRRDR